MKKIKANIYIESSYPGVTVGALTLPGGTVLIDAPLRPDDSLAWLSALEKVGAVGPKLLVNLDSHPDRSRGAQGLNSQVLAHEEAAKESHKRAAIFKSLKQESGAEWENLEGLSTLRWVMPNIVYTDQSQLSLNGSNVFVEAHPGPSPGASWLVLPDAKVVFVGDAVAKKEPPFLAHADIPAWLDSLSLLLAKEFKGYRIICGRGGEVKAVDVREMRRRGEAPEAAGQSQGGAQ